MFGGIGIAHGSWEDGSSWNGTQVEQVNNEFPWVHRLGIDILGPCKGTTTYDSGAVTSVYS